MTSSKKQKLLNWHRYLHYGGDAFLLALIRKYEVIGHSMEPTLKNGEEIIVNRLSYILFSPKINDVVAIADEMMKIYIKRIKEISDGKYYVLGDNPQDSKDSRSFGWIEKKDIIGKVVYKGKA